MSETKGDLFSGIRKLFSLLDSHASSQELSIFAKSPEAAEVFFNIDPGKLIPKQRKAVREAAKARMDYLKMGFEGKGGGRNMAGKMEYDTLKACFSEDDWQE